MNGAAAKPVATDDRSSRAAVWGTVSLIAGILLSLLGLGILSAAAGAFLSFGQDDEGFLATPTETFATDAYAITTPSARFIMDRGVPELPFDLATVQLQASSNTDSEIFIGIGPAGDVQRYLDGVSRTEVRQVNYFPFRPEYRDVAGSQARAAPTDQTFWAASASGMGTQEIEWIIEPGNWVNVVMNADGTEGVSAELSAGVRSDLFAPVATALIIAGIILLLIGLPLLVLGAIGLGRSIPRALGPASVTAAGRAERVHPAQLVGVLDPGLSRWLWLVKWILAIPHFLILFFLWFAFVVCTVAAGFAILFTGRYPRSLFEFNVGVLRWSWRVGFYSYGALGTDKYPPFSLAPVNYPAEFSVDYPERLSNGLVLVKWWLLAIPHYLILAAVGGVVLWGPFSWEFDNGDELRQDGISLLAVLVLIAAVILLFTAKYPGALFDLAIGINRWAYRVITYAALMRDEYPPFRLDQGALEPARLSDLCSEALEQL